MLSARIDPQGGMAGDMFAAALIDAMPGLEPVIGQVLQALPFPQGTKAMPVKFHDGMFGGHRLDVQAGGSKHHTSWREIRSMIDGAAISPAVKSRALTIFGEIAEVEASIHCLRNG